MGMLDMVYVSGLDPLIINNFHNKVIDKSDVIRVYT